MAETLSPSNKKSLSDYFFVLLEDLWLVLMILVVGAILLLWLGSRIQAFGVLSVALHYIFITSPVWLAFMLGLICWDLWLNYARLSTISEMKPVLLEISLPKDTTKTPLAMEIVFSSLHIPGAATFLEQYWSGKLRPWYSLELVSLGGDVHFYIWTDSKQRNIVEAQVYAQYPGVAIHQVDDYTEQVHWDPDKWIMWGTHFKLVEKDVYPIKTYIDYGLDKAGLEEEEKIDPLTSMLEYLGSLKPGEQCWIQILIQAHKKEGLQEGRLFKKPDWKKEAKEEIEKIRAEATPDRPGSEFPGFPNPTKGQVEKISALERSINKFPFETMIRGFYIARPDVFNGSNIPGLIGSVRQYSSPDLNGFKLGKFTDHGDTGKDLASIFGWVPPFGNYMKKRRNLMEQEMLDAYKKRSIFNPPYKHYRNKPFILNTEELATIFHLPGAVATTPTLQKIESKRAEPPVNLPL